MSEAPRVLLVDDRPANLDVLCKVLEADGYRVLLAPSGEVALKTASKVQLDLILLDITMPEMDGYEVCRRLKADEKTRGIPVIFITARDVHEEIVKGFELGAVDYITKPFNEGEVLARSRTHVEMSRLHRQLEEKNRLLQEEISQRRKFKGHLSMISQEETERWGLEVFIGKSPMLQHIFKDIRLMQESDSVSVLILGESGTGKELIARSIHFGSQRRQGPFIPVNCAALPQQLAESLFFGHSKGAFTGADDDQVGYFEMADGGTLFLDELGEMPVELQAKLLRALEEKEIWPVGGKTARRVDVRVLGATNVDLRKLIADGTFRQDLFYRLNRFSVTAPPLRERRDDIPLLAAHFLEVFAREMNRAVVRIEPEAIAALQRYDFPGNVRELKNTMERALIECTGVSIRAQDVYLAEPLPETQGAGVELPMDIDQAAQAAELWVVKRALRESGGNLSQAARLLGTNRNRMYRVLEQERVEDV